MFLVCMLSTKLMQLHWRSWIFLTRLITMCLLLDIWVGIWMSWSIGCGSIWIYLEFIPSRKEKIQIIRLLLLFLEISVLLKVFATGSIGLWFEISDTRWCGALRSNSTLRRWERIINCMMRMWYRSSKKYDLQNCPIYSHILSVFTAHSNYEWCYILKSQQIDIIINSSNNKIRWQTE